MRYRRTILYAIVFAIGVATPAVFGQEAGTPPPHVQQAESLVESLKGAQENVYGGGKRHIDWAPGHAAARTVCSSFVTLLLEHTYGWKDEDIKTWIGKRDPEASDLYDAIAAKNGFLSFHTVDKIQVGDIIAIKYNDGSPDTGHVVLVDQAPQKIASEAPKIADTTQYAVTIIDSSRSGHGPTDTRHEPGGGFTGGIGRGVMRLYTNKDGKIIGYAWSTTHKSEYYTAPARELIVGRLNKPPLNP